MIDARIKIYLLSLLSFLAMHDAHADSPSKRVRAGFSVGTIRNGGAAISADAGPILSESVSGGFEFFGLRLISLRALVWEHPKNLSGFNGGPKLYLGLGDKIVLEPGAEGGWSYRMNNRIDVGLGIDLVFSNAIGGSLKVGLGVLF